MPSCLYLPRRRLKYKQAYEDFKLRFTFIFIGISLVQLLLITTSTFFDAVIFFLCLYYYSTVVLREHILVVNGSDIRAWWIAHHYVCVGISGIMLIWPAGPNYIAIRPTLLSFFIYIGILPQLPSRSNYTDDAISISDEATLRS